MKRAVASFSRPSAVARTLRQHAAKMSSLAPLDRFEGRHNGPRKSDVDSMLSTIGVASVDALVDMTVPSAIKLGRPLDLGKYSEGLTETEALSELQVNENRAAAPVKVAATRI